jgi:hypothetical protein
VKLSEADVKDHLAVIQEKTKNFDPKDLGDEGSEFTSTESIGFCEMIGKVASSGDYAIFSFGLICAAGFGSSMPLFCFYFGEMIDSMGGSGDDSGFESL